MVVELGPETRAWGVYPGGQSGNPGNPQYMQMVEDWQEGRYHRLRPDKTPGELKDIQTRHWKINP
jgi:acyl-homoserine lactone acylase PvdQ